ncbi:hypothetical protein HZB93_00640 [Candidatus Falkowbacteria bacterium]|nr:hypothetical protein [Candidatus Falkowbacteria bacterium]
MRFITLIVAVLFAQNAFAQTSESTEQTEQSAAPVILGEAGNAALTSCLEADDGTQCCTDYGDCVQNLGDNSEQCAAVARLCGHQDLDAAMREGCQQRNAIVQGSECACAAGLSWNNESDKVCCTANPATYERRRNACEHSGGTYHCNSRGGWCGCPLGMSHPIEEDGDVDYSSCTGEAVNRERLQAMRDNIATLTAEVEEAGQQIAALQAERDALRAQLDQTLSQLAELDNLEDTVGEMEQRLAEMDAELSFLRHLRDQYEEFIARQAQTIADLGGIPPLPPGIPEEDEPLPGTAAAVAEAAGGSRPGPMEPLPPPEEEEGNWCSENGWACAGIIIGAAAALAGATVGIVEATRDIQVTQ